MTPSFTSLIGSQSSTDADSYDTASVTPTASRLLIAFIANSHLTSPATPTLSGGGVSTWTEIVSVLITDSDTRLTAFRALTGASPTSGAITIDFSANTQQGCGWSVIEVSDCVLTGTNGADAVAQSKTTNPASTGTTAQATFDSAWGADDNRALAGFALGSGRAITPGTGFESVASVVMSSPSRTLAVISGRDSDQQVDISWTTGTTRCAVALEIVGASAGAGPGTIVIPRMSIRGFNRWVN